MKALITGISGFVGPHLQAHLEKNAIEVFGIDKHPAGERVFEADMLDFGSIADIIAQVKPDLVFHLAGFSSVKKSFEQPELCKKVNVQGTKHLLDAIMKAQIRPKTLIVTSAEVYGIPKTVPIKETAELHPVTPYGESRKEQEALCKTYAEKIPLVIARSFNHIGPGQPPPFVTADFAKQIAEIEKGLQEPVMRIGNLAAKRDFTDVRDIVRAYLLALQKCTPGEAYNICSGSAHAIQEILDILLSFAQVKITTEHDPTRMRPSDIPILQGDKSKFTSATGWKPDIDIKTSLKDILDYWRAANHTKTAA